MEVPHPVVADPSTILLQIPHWAKYFTVIDLTTVWGFFSIPTDQGEKKSQLLLVFFEERAAEDLDASPPRVCGFPYNIFADIKKLFKWCKIAGRISTRTKKGHCASPSKLQLHQKKVKYVGFILKAGQQELDLKRRETIIKLPRPTTKKPMRRFLSTVGFCRP